MQLFFYPDLTSPTIELPEEESKHLLKVLRKKKGDEITLIDGKGNEATGIIESDHQKKCQVLISQPIHHLQTKSYYLHIAIAPTKQTDRMDWFIEKAVETGVDEITFIATQNSERNKINIERCEKITVAAIKQSKQYWLPKINNIKKLPSFIEDQKLLQSLKLIAWCEENTGHSIERQLQNKPENIVVLIGPEGDFTANEISLAQQSHFIPVSLGSNILRTETAGVFVCVACALN